MLIHFLCFFWPPVMSAAFLVYFSKRIKSQAAFFVFATLVLFGISRLVSTEVVPLIVGLMPTETAVDVVDSINQIHGVGQMFAALAGWIALRSLSSYFAFRRVWNEKTRSWQFGEKIADSRSQGK